MTKYRMQTPGYRNGGFIDFYADSKQEAEKYAESLVRSTFTSLTKIVLEEITPILKSNIPIEWK